MVKDKLVGLNWPVQRPGQEWRGRAFTIQVITGNWGENLPQKGLCGFCVAATLQSAVADSPLVRFHDTFNVLVGSACWQARGERGEVHDLC